MLSTPAVHLFTSFSRFYDVNDALHETDQVKTTLWMTYYRNSISLLFTLTVVDDII